MQFFHSTNLQVYRFFLYRKKLCFTKNLFLTTPISSPLNPLSIEKVIGWMLGPNCFITKDLNYFTSCCYVRCLTSIVWAGGLPWPQTGTSHNHAYLGLPIKVSAVQGLVVCYVVVLGKVRGCNLRTCARCAGLVPCCGLDC